MSNQNQIDLLSDSKLFSTAQILLEQKIRDVLNRKLNELKVQISKILTEEEIATPGFNLSRLVDQFQINQSQCHINLRIFPIKKGRTKKDAHEDVRCMARIGLGTQCTRKITATSSDSEYCKYHASFLPYGRIDGPLEQKAIKPIAKKRGRKLCARTYQLEELDLSRYVQASIVQIDGVILIQDEHGMLYRNDQTNQIVGRATIDGIEWY